MVKGSILSVVALLLLGSCAATKLVTMPVQQDLVNEPPVGEVRTVEVGDTLVRTAKVTEVPALKLSEDVEAGGTGWAWGNKAFYKAGIYVAQYTDASQTCYESLEPIRVTALGIANNLRGGICVSRNKPGEKTLFMGGPSNNAIYKPRNEIRVTDTTYIDKSKPGFWQELIYNGKSGDSVKFLYREFTNEVARPAFDQVVEYDLKDGTTIGFKGARLDILAATNTNISYKVIAHFPPPGGAR